MCRNRAHLREGGEGMTRGKYTRDFYFIPTILYHNGDGIYASLELAWLKWYIGFCWIINEGEEKE